MKTDILYVSLTGFVMGVFFRSFFDFGISFSSIFILLGFVLGVFYFFKKPNDTEIFLLDDQSKTGDLNKNISEKILITAILFLFIGLGMLRMDFSNLDKNNLILDNFVGEKISVEGIVADEPDVREDNTHLVVNFSLDNQDESNDIKSKMIIFTNHYPKYNYGDKIKIIGELQEPKNFKTGDDREFDYVSYLAKDGINYQMFYPQTEFISSGNGNFVKEKLFNLKNSFLSNIKKVIPEPQSSLLGGLVVGAKESLGKDLQEKFRKVGLIHIVVLSGYNLSIVADSIMKSFTFLPNVFAISFGAIGIIFFAIMTGASATIIRASIMALLVLLARSTGRVNQVTRSLFIAGFIMLIHNPKILVFDPSFQLSFMATLGLIVVSPKIENCFNFLPTRFKLRESIIATISTQIFVLPLILYMMGDFSLVAIFVNLLVLIFIPVTMLFGFLSGLIGYVSLILALPFSYLTYGLLTYELKVVDIFASLSFASFHITYFPFWLMLVVYGIYFWVFKNKKRSDDKVA